MKRSIHLTFVLSALISISLIGCKSFNSDLSNYDPVTYKNLTDLKPETIELFESFSDSSIDPKTISLIRLKIAQIYEYEKGKGLKNQETLKQIEKIRDMFQRHVQNRSDHGPWSKEFKANKEENMSEAFDIAIKSETLKNREE